MKHCCCLGILITVALAAPAYANVRVKVDTVPADYAPINAPTFRESVSVSGYHFEVNEETVRARLVVDYTYPDQMTFGPDDDAGGPRPTVVQLPELTYDPAAHAVVYDSNGTKVVCATVHVGRSPFGRRLDVRNTGACTVSTILADHAEDDGWSIRRSRALDTYLVVR